MIGAKTLALEKKFNDKAGITSKSDRLPSFFYTEISDQAGVAFDVPGEEMDRIFEKLM